MRQLISIILIFATQLIISQESNTSFKSIDSSTYVSYINNEWNAIIKTGKQGLKNNIDYYYLRMRLGYAYFKKSNYLSAIKHYKKALAYSNQDPIAMEYLYYCYLNSGRKKDAQKISKSLPNSVTENLSNNAKPHTSEIAFFISTSQSETTDFYTKVVNSGTAINGTQKIPLRFNNYNLILGHKINSTVSIKHNFNLLFKDESSYAIVNNLPYVSEEQNINQFNYTVNLPITPYEGFTVTPLFSFTNYKYPVYFNYGMGYGKERTVYEYKTIKYYAYGLSLQQRFRLFNFDLSYTHSDFNASNQELFAGLIRFFPFGNLNIYLTTSTFVNYQHIKNADKTQIAFEHEFGVKIFKNLWLEGTYRHGEINNFYHPFTGIVYNSAELQNNMLGVKLIIPVYKAGVSFFVNYSNYMVKSIFVSTENPLEFLNHYKINYQTITGGVSWNF